MDPYYLIWEKDSSIMILCAHQCETMGWRLVQNIRAFDSSLIICRYLGTMVMIQNKLCCQSLFLIRVFQVRADLRMVCEQSLNMVMLNRYLNDTQCWIIMPARLLGTWRRRSATQRETLKAYSRLPWLSTLEQARS